MNIYYTKVVISFKSFSLNFKCLILIMEISGLLNRNEVKVLLNESDHVMKIFGYLPNILAGINQSDTSIILPYLCESFLLT